MGLWLPTHVAREAVTDDVTRLPDKVKYGDPHVGWRGDDTMSVWGDAATETVQVWGVDGRGEDYLAVVVSPLEDPDWRHTILRKLRDGDWQRGDQRLKDLERRNRRQAEELRRKHAEQRAELSARFAHHARRVLASHIGGRHRIMTVPEFGSRN